jgi:allantoin racemase
MAGPDPDARMRILLVNVNTSTSVTGTVTAAARMVVAPTTEVVGVTPRFGPEAVEGPVDGYVAAVAVMDAVASFEQPYDAVVLAGFGEPGRDGLQDLVDVPVVDITDAAALTACLLGRRFGVVTTGSRSVPMIEDRLRLAGLDARCAGVRASGISVGQLEADPLSAVDGIAAHARRLVQQDGADVVVLGCAAMAGLGPAVSAALGAAPLDPTLPTVPAVPAVPVVDGVPSAALLAEGLVRQGLRTSTADPDAAAHLTDAPGWPLARLSTVR